MANDLALIEPIPVPANPARMPSLPVWLERCSGALANVNQRDEAGQHRRVDTLPAKLIPSSSERAAIVQHVARLSRFLDLDQPITLRDREMDNASALGVMIAALLAKKGQRMDAAVSEALTEDYLDALDDLPAWAVREAIRKWNRAESAQLDRKPHDFNWRPEPPTLRRLAFIEFAVVKDRIDKLSRVLNAVPLLEYSPEHTVQMRAKLAEASPILRAMLMHDARMRRAKELGAEADRLAKREAAE